LKPGLYPPSLALRERYQGLKRNLKTLGITIKVELIWKVALLGTARIGLLRKVLEHV